MDIKKEIYLFQNWRTTWILYQSSVLLQAKLYHCKYPVKTWIWKYRVEDKKDNSHLIIRIPALTLN